MCLLGVTECHNLRSSCRAHSTSGAHCRFYTQENAAYTTANWTDVRLRDGDVNNTADPQLYWTERWGAFNYTLPYLENGLYEVSINMAESYWKEPKDRNFYIQVQVSYRSLDPAPQSLQLLYVGKQLGT